MALGAAVTVLLAIVLLVSVRRLVGKPLLEAVRVTKRVASGDLACEIQVKSGDEVGQLMQALGEMTATLTAVVGELQIVIQASQDGCLGVRGTRPDLRACTSSWSRAAIRCFRTWPSRSSSWRRVLTRWRCPRSS